MPANENVVIVWVNAIFGLTYPRRLADPIAKIKSWKIIILKENYTASIKWGLL